jgi:hypothetical protein
VDLYAVNPEKYTIFIFVCGPWRFDQVLLGRFQHCVKIGVNLSIAEEGMQGFDYLLPRDTPTENNPDLVFSAKTSLVPVVGIVLVHPQPIYGKRQRHHIVQKVVDDLVCKGEIAPLWMDTLLRDNVGSLKNTAQFESLIRRTDLVISTRLHGMVFSLKNGIPVIAIDPVAGGAKITAQANALGWQLLINGEDLTRKRLSDAMEVCLKGSLATEIVECRLNAEKAILNIKDKMVNLLNDLSLE